MKYLAVKTLTINMALYMEKYFALVGILLASHIYANSFSCGDSDPAVCKTKFTKSLNNDLNILHLNGVRKYFSTYVNISKVISSELPENDVVKPELDDAITKVSKGLENLNIDTLDEKNFATFKGEEYSEHYNQLAKKHLLRETLFEVLNTLHMDTAKLWADFYTGLRAEDKTAYPAYETVNNFMEQILTIGENKTAKMALYAKAVQIIAHEFSVK